MGVNSFYAKGEITHPDPTKIKRLNITIVMLHSFLISSCPVNPPPADEPFTTVSATFPSTHPHYQMYPQLSRLLVV